MPDSLQLDFNGFSCSLHYAQITSLWSHIASLDILFVSKHSCQMIADTVHLPAGLLKSAVVCFADHKVCRA